MIDIIKQLDAIRREVARRPAGDSEEVVVLVRRTYDSPVDDVWSAITEPERVARWLYPVSGDLRAGGSFQLEGNAGGDILGCEPPEKLRVTFGLPTSIVEVRLRADGDGATLVELEHTVPIEIARSGAGALWVGPGWDDAVASLDLHLRGELVADAAAWHDSPEVKELSRESVPRWAAAVEASGTATAEHLAEAVQVSLAQFAGGGDDPVG